MVVNDATVKYRLAVCGRVKTDATAAPIVLRLVVRKGSLPESKIVAVLFGIEKPKEPTLRP